MQPDALVSRLKILDLAIIYILCTPISLLNFRTYVELLINVRIKDCLEKPDRRQISETTYVSYYRKTMPSDISIILIIISH